MGSIEQIASGIAQFSIILIVLIIVQGIISIIRYYVKLKAFVESREWIKDFAERNPEFSASDIARIADALGSHRIQFDDRGRLPLDQLAELVNVARR